MLGEAEFFDVMRQGLWVAVVISGPILAVALGVGLLIGLFQALTSMQEMTLTFVPKVGAILATFWMSMSFMTKHLMMFWSGTIIPIIVGG